MSSDNYYIVRPTADGRWTALMGFASCEDEPIQDEHDPVFDTRDEAFDFALSKYSEYGVRG